MLARFPKTERLILRNMIGNPDRDTSDPNASNRITPIETIPIGVVMPCRRRWPLLFIPPFSP